MNNLLIAEGFGYLRNNKFGELFYEFRQGKYGFTIYYVNDTVLWQPLTFTDNKTLHYDDSNAYLNQGITTIGESLIPYLGVATTEEVVNLKHELFTLFSNLPQDSEYKKPSKT